MPDKHSFDFVKTMSQYGVVLGCLVGFFGTIPLTITWFEWSRILPVIAVLLMIGLCGALIGLLYGGVAGYVSGWIVKIVTRYIFQDLKQTAVYKVAVGAITVAVTYIIIQAGSMWLRMDFEKAFARPISPVELQALGIMGLVFAVYASQRVATDYLRDMDVR